MHDLAFAPRLGHSGQVTLPSSGLRSGFRGLLCAAVASGCSARALSIDTPLPSAAAGNVSEPAAPARDGLETWASSSSSPRPAPAEVGLPGCGPPEQSLLSAAREVARLAAEQGPWDASDLVAWVRSAGGPFVWPRAWTLQGATLDSAALESGLRSWLERTPPIG